MKPLYLITPTFLPERGGQELLVDRLANEFGRYYSAYVVTPRRGAIAKRIPAIKRNYRLIRTPPTGKTPYLLLNGQIGLISTMTGFVRSHGKSILHLFEPFHLGLSVSAIKNMTNSTFILSLIGSTTYDPFTTTHHRFKYYMKFIMDNADAVTASTRELGERGRDQGYNGEIHIIPHGIDTNQFHPKNAHKRNELRRALGVKEDEPMIFAVQRLHPRKRTSQLILAAAEVLKSLPSAKFIIGGRGREMEQLQKLIVSLKLQDSVKLIGYIPDSELPFYYAAADIFALHTLYEGFGIVVIEAMASGLPVVTTNVGGMDDIVEDNGAGIIVPPNNPSEMAEAILTTLEAKKHQRYAEHARRAAEEKYSTKKVCLQYIDLYQSV